MREHGVPTLPGLTTTEFACLKDARTIHL